jgi:hypothetical protein
MKTGSIVKIYKNNHWGGLSPRNKFGVLIKQTYSAYDSNFNKWDVLIDSKIISLNEKLLKVQS